MAQIPGSQLMLEVFETIEEAERIIQQEKQRRPEVAELIDETFLLLRPLPKALSSLYEAHCLEMIDRWVTLRQGWRGSWPPKAANRRAQVRNVLLPPTNAELCQALAAMSLKVPPGTYIARAYEQLFERLFPGKLKSMGVNRPYVVASRQQLVDEVIYKLKTELAQLTPERLPDEWK